MYKCVFTTIHCPDLNFFFPLASLERHFYGTGTYGYYVGRRLGRGCAVERYEVAFHVPTSEAARQKFFWLP
jgi:hypothetical protein